MPCFLPWLLLLTQAVAPAIPTQSAFETEIHELQAAHPDLLRVASIGRSAGGSPILALQIGAGRGDEVREILLVAGIDGRRPAGALVALAAARLLLSGPPLPSDVRITIVARGNPDGLAGWTESPIHMQSGNSSPVDDDRDWRADEDGPEDVDGDGRILVQRVRDPEGQWIPDPAEPRLLRRADPRKGEAGIYLRMHEGVDDDGDGLINEDGRGGAEPGRNFPYLFPEHEVSAGRYALETPEAKAIADYLVGHRRIAIVVALDGFDNVTREPETGTPKRGWPREPSTLLHPDDGPAQKLLAERLRTALGLEKKAGKWKAPGGGLAAYAYLQLGIVALSVPVWDLPPRIAGGETGRHGEEHEKMPPEDPSMARNAAWLGYADAHPELGGWVPWHSVPHPQYGEVEIGGFVPGFREIPPANEVRRLGAGLAGFLHDASGMLPRVRIASEHEERRGAGIYRVEAVVRNVGVLPLCLRQGVVTGHVRNTLITVKCPGGEVITGDTPARLPTLQAGGEHRFEWWIRSAPGNPVTVEVDSVLGGHDRSTLHLDARREKL